MSFVAAKNAGPQWRPKNWTGPSWEPDPHRWRAVRVGEHDGLKYVPAGTPVTVAPGGAPPRSSPSRETILAIERQLNAGKQLSRVPKLVESVKE